MKNKKNEKTEEQKECERHLRKGFHPKTELEKKQEQEEER